MEIEKTLTFTKPGNFEYCLEIFECLDDSLGRDFAKTVPIHLTLVPEELIREHYKNIKGKLFYEWTIQAFLKSKDGIVFRGYEGYNIVSRMRKAAGHTDPQKAKSGTVRTIFSNDSLEVAFREKRYLNNVIHCSSSVEDAQRELRLWGEYIDKLKFIRIEKD